MKKIISSLLIGLVLLNVCGFNLLFSFLLLSCKYEAAEKIEELSDYASLTHLIINSYNKDEFIRIGKDEVMYKNQMYDIVSEKGDNHETHLYCIQDKNENEVRNSIKNFDKNLKEFPNSERKENSSYVLNNLIKNYIFPDYNFGKVVSESIFFFSHTPTQLQPITEIINPPPESKLV